MEDLKSWAMRIGTVIVAAALYVLSATLLKDSDAGPAVTLLAGALVGLLFPQIGKRAAMIAIMALGLSSTACSGSLEQNRAAGANDRKFGLTAAGAGTPERRQTLDSRRAFYGGAGKVAATLAGVSGLSVIPLDDHDQRDLRVGVAAAGVAAAAVAAGAMFVAEAAGESFVRECSQ